MSTTLTDIARETKTSVSTVSRVLAGGKLAMRISEATRSRIMAAANRLGYRPNLLARSLRTRKSNTVAFVVSDIANPWFGQLASLIEQILYRRGISLMLCNTQEDADREAEYLRMLPQKGIDGMIIVPLLRNKKNLLDLVPAGLPVVVLDRPIPGIDASVATDPEQLAGSLCDTLERARVKTVAIVSGPLSIVTHRRRAEIAASRFKVIDTYEGPAQMETGRQAMIRFMELKNQPDAIICTNNLLGQGVLEPIGEIEDPPILGVFDEIPMMHLLPLPIVCSLQDVPMLAEAAVQQLLPQLDGNKKPSEPILLSARVITNKAFQQRASQ